MQVLLVRRIDLRTLAKCSAGALSARLSQARILIYGTALGNRTLCALKVC